MRAPPRSPVCPSLVRAWLRYLQQRPLEEWEIGPARDPRSVHQDPEIALALGPDGVAYWWPVRHPETGERLTRETRRLWFTAWLTEELLGRQQWLRRGARSYWRRVIGQALLLKHAEEEPWAIPFPPELERARRGR